MPADTTTAEATCFNYALSWMAFNRRVLEEAQDPRNPLVERAKFLAIVTSNLNEFIMVRVAQLYRQRESTTRDASGLTPGEALEQVRQDIDQLVEEQYRCFNDEIAPALSNHGMTLVAPADWTPADRESLMRLYRDRIEPTLTPTGVDSGRPFPLLASGKLHVAVQVRSLDEAADSEPLRALVAVPEGKRLIGLGDDGRFALLEDVVAQFAGSLFSGHEIVDRGVFRVIRDADLEIDEDQATDLLQEIEEELRHRAYGRSVRLEIAYDLSEPLREWLVAELGIAAADLDTIDGPLDLTCLFATGAYVSGPGLQYDEFTPRPCQRDWSDPFAAMRSGAFLLHFPFDSFDPVVQLVDRAAEDPQVLAIKQTLYRVSSDSPIVAALMRAARAGKQVTVLVELKARFDEDSNIRWARRLEEAGAHVVYGLVGYKVHTKLLMIIRRDEDGIRRYCQIGTGNYNDKTAKIYTDLSYFTINEAVGRDVGALFNMLTGFSQPPEWERLSVAPTTLRSDFVDLIRREAELAQAGDGGRIVAKFNSLVDAGIVEELYAASQAGVEIDLIVRGMCTLKPGVPGLSETIRVRSIVGRFLEHSRIYVFGNGGEPVVLIGSADWMTRNLDRRVEACVVVEEREIVDELLRICELQLADDLAARELGPDGVYRRLKPVTETNGLRSQDYFLAESSTGVVRDDDLAPKLVPIRPE